VMRRASPGRLRAARLLQLQSFAQTPCARAPHVRPFPIHDY